MANGMTPQQTVLGNIGGAYVRRPFSFFGRWMKPGDHLNGEQLHRIPFDNLKALRDSEFIETYPKAPPGAQDPAAELFVIHRGSGKYDVIRGVKLNSEPLSKEAAEALAIPVPAKAAA